MTGRKVLAWLLGLSFVLSPSSFVLASSAPFLNKRPEGDRLLIAAAGPAPQREGTLFYGWRPWQRRTVLLTTVATAATFGILANRDEPRSTVPLALAGAAIGFAAGGLLVLAIDEVHYLWTGEHLEPFNTYRFSLPGDAVTS